MRKNVFFNFTLLILLSIPLIAQNNNEIIVKADVSEAIVFINGAQIHRKKKIDLPSGKSTVKLADLSPYIDGKSVQVKIDGKVMVLSVDYKVSKKSDNELDKNKVLQEKLNEIDDLINLEKVNNDIIKEEISFLRENKNIGGSSNGINYDNFQQTTAFYSESFSKLKYQEIKIDKKIRDLSTQRLEIEKQIKDIKNETDKLYGEIIVQIDAKSPLKGIDLDVSYYVNNVSWYPSYDIKANGITENIELIYKVNIKQNTKEDWKNIKLKISSNEANNNNVIPKLQTYFLNYYVAPPQYTFANSDFNVVTGKLMDASEKEPLIGGSIYIKGTTIGTLSDLNGDYSITIPPQGGRLVASYVGMKTQEKEINNSVINFLLEDDDVILDEVVVTGIGKMNKRLFTGATDKKDVASNKLGGVVDISRELEGRSAGVSVQNVSGAFGSAPRVSVREPSKQIPIPVVQIENKTSVEFDIEKPYTVLSGDVNKTVVEVAHYSLPAEFEYYSIPKIDKSAFLTAKVINWHQYNLLEGEANIFFENTYVGKTLLALNYLSDTLNLSLGKDKNVVVQREKIKEYQSSKFIGGKSEQTRVWKTIVKNNKSQPIKILLLDQIPVSTLQEIEVIPENISAGELDKRTGEVKWLLMLQPNEKQEIDLQYKVKYPRGRTLYIE